MNTTEFKKHVTNLLKEENLPTTSPLAKTGDVKNPVDTKPELQKYLRDLSIKVSSITGVDSKEIKDLATIINGIITDVDKASLSPVLQQVLKVYDNRTKNLG